MTIAGILVVAAFFLFVLCSFAFLLYSLVTHERASAPRKRLGSDAHSSDGGASSSFFFGDWWPGDGGSHD